MAGYDLSATRCALFAKHTVQDYSESNRQSAISPKGWLEYLINLFIPGSVRKAYSLQYDKFTQALIDTVEKKIADPDDYAIPQTLEFTVGANKVSYSPTPSSWYNGEVRVEVKITEPDNHTLIETVDHDLFTRTLTLLLLQKRTPYSSNQYSLTKEGKLNLRSADLNGYVLRNINLREADLEGARFTYANLSRADLRGANLEEADMRRALLEGACLTDANLRFAWLSEARLHQATLTGADCYKTKLRQACLAGADLKHADLSYADLSRADLNDADLSHANLSKASLRQTTQCGTHLAHANLNGAFVDGWRFDGANLSEAQSRPFAAEIPVTEL